VIDEYFRSVARYSPQLGGRDGLRGIIDGILNELQIPATLDQDGDWRFQSDVGPWFLILESDGRHLTLLQNIEAIDGRPKNSADSMLLLLLMNYEAPGLARFSAVQDNNKKVLVLSSRMPVSEVDREGVEKLLTDGMRLSRTVDEALGKAPAEPEPAPEPQAQNGSPPAGWYADPQNAGAQRWWDGTRWTEHVA
jgi:hypothetical protein